MLIRLNFKAKTSSLSPVFGFWCIDFNLYTAACVGTRRAQFKHQRIFPFPQFIFCFGRLSASRFRAALGIIATGL